MRSAAFQFRLVDGMPASRSTTSDCRARTRRSTAESSATGLVRRPSLKSSTSILIVSCAQDLLVPMNPLGPRLIQPVA